MSLERSNRYLSIVVYDCVKYPKDALKQNRPKHAAQAVTSLQSQPAEVEGNRHLPIDIEVDCVRNPLADIFLRPPPPTNRHAQRKRRCTADLSDETDVTSPKLADYSSIGVVIKSEPGLENAAGRASTATRYGPVVPLTWKNLLPISSQMTTSSEATFTGVPAAASLFDAPTPPTRTLVPDPPAEATGSESPADEAVPDVPADTTLDGAIESLHNVVRQLPPSARKFHALKGLHALTGTSTEAEGEVKQECLSPQHISIGMVGSLAMSENTAGEEAAIDDSGGWSSDGDEGMEDTAYSECSSESCTGTNLKCPLCAFTEPRAKHFLSHLQTHSWQCAVCTKWQMGYNEYKRHATKCKAGDTVSSTVELDLVNTFNCAVCKVFASHSREEIIQHLSQNHCTQDSTGAVSCPLCDASISSKESFSSHCDSYCTMSSLCDSTRAQEDLDTLPTSHSSMDTDRENNHLQALLAECQTGRSEGCPKCEKDIPFGDLVSHLAEVHRWQCRSCEGWVNEVSINSFRDHIASCQKLKSKKQFNSVLAYMEYYDISPNTQRSTDPHTSSRRGRSLGKRKPTAEQSDKVKPRSDPDFGAQKEQQSQVLTRTNTNQLKGRHKCPMCPQSYATAYGVNRHIQAVGHVWKCDTCQIWFRLEEKEGHEASCPGIDESAIAAASNKQVPDDTCHICKIYSNTSEYRLSQHIQWNHQDSEAGAHETGGPMNNTASVGAPSNNEPSCIPSSVGERSTSLDSQNEQQSQVLTRTNTNQLKGRHKCPMCPQSYATAYGVNRHIQAVGHVWKCETCQLWFRLEEKEGHEASCLGIDESAIAAASNKQVPDDTCHICKIYSNTSEYRLSQHIQWNHQKLEARAHEAGGPTNNAASAGDPSIDEPSYVPSSVGEISTSLHSQKEQQSQVLTHTNTNQLKGRHKCPMCPQSYATAYGVNRHIQAVGHVWKCGTCQLWFRLEEKEGHEASCPGIDETAIAAASNRQVPDDTCHICKIYSNTSEYRLSQHIQWNHSDAKAGADRPVDLPDNNISKVSETQSPPEFTNSSTSTMSRKSSRASKSDAVPEEQVKPTSQVKSTVTRRSSANSKPKCDAREQVPSKSKSSGMADSPKHQCVVCYKVCDSALALSNHIEEVGHVWRCKNCHKWFKEEDRANHDEAKCKEKVEVIDIGAPLPPNTCPVCRLYTNPSMLTVLKHVEYNHMGGAPTAQEKIEVESATGDDDMSDGGRDVADDDMSDGGGDVGYDYDDSDVDENYEPPVDKVTSRKSRNRHSTRSSQIKDNGENSSKPYVCQQCNKGFTSKFSLKRHNNKLHYQGATCHLCNQRMDSVAKLQRHSRICGKIFKCITCFKEFDRHEDVKEHVKEHRALPKQCGQVGDSAQSHLPTEVDRESKCTVEDLSRYTKWKLDNGEYACPACPKQCPTASELLRHMSDVGHVWQCANCSVWFKEEDRDCHVEDECEGIARGTVATEGNVEVAIGTCPVCKIYKCDSSRHNMRVHMDLNHKLLNETGEIECPCCHQSIDMESSLPTHLKQKCSKFQELFGDLVSENEDHMVPSGGDDVKVVSDSEDIKPKKLLAATDINSDSDTSSDGISKEYTIQSRRPVLSCPRCKMQFKLLHAYTSHVAYCGHQPATKPNTQRHPLYESLGGYFPCPVCEEKYQSPRQLWKHMVQEVGHVWRCKSCFKWMRENDRRHHNEDLCQEDPGFDMDTDTESTPNIAPQTPAGTCPVCKIYQADSRENFTRHILANHVRATSDGDISCPSCLQVVGRDREQLRHHLLEVCGNGLLDMKEVATSESTTVSKKYQCTLCQMKYASITSLNWHMRMHVWKCAKCECWFHERERDSHTYTKCDGVIKSFDTPVSPNTCPICRIYKNSVNGCLASHMVYSHKTTKADGRTVCCCCSKTIPVGDRNYKRHLLKECKNVPFKQSEWVECAACKMVFRNQNALNKHHMYVGHVKQCEKCRCWYKISHTSSHDESLCQGGETLAEEGSALVPPNTCPVCKIHYEGVKHLMAHHITCNHKVETETGALQCPLCLAQLDDNELSLKTHLLKDCRKLAGNPHDDVDEDDGAENNDVAKDNDVTEKNDGTDESAVKEDDNSSDEVYKCIPCHKQFDTLLKYKMHQLIHVWKCEQCGNWDLERNRKSHNASKCKIDEELKIDPMSNTTTACPVCKVFKVTNRSYLYRHIILNHKIKMEGGRLQCPICPDVSVNGELCLLEHLLGNCPSLFDNPERDNSQRKDKRKVDKVKKFICPVCGKGFRTQHMLKKHIVEDVGHVWQCSTCSKWFEEEERDTHLPAICEGTIEGETKESAPLSGSTCRICLIYSSQHRHNLATHISVNHKEVREDGECVCPYCSETVDKDQIALREHIKLDCKRFEEVFSKKSEKLVVMEKNPGIGMADGSTGVGEVIGEYDQSTDEEVDAEVESESDSDESGGSMEAESSDEMERVQVEEKKYLKKKVFCVNPVPCHVCKEGPFRTSLQFYRHLFQNHDVSAPKGRVQCKVCLKVLDVDEDMTQHKRSASCIITYYYCDVCFKFFSTNSGYLSHKEAFHGSKKTAFHCHQCGESFPTIIWKRKHIQFHRKEEKGETKYLACLVCHVMCANNFDRAFHEKHEHFIDGKCCVASCQYRLIDKLHYRFRYKMAIHITKHHPALASDKTRHYCKYGCPKLFSNNVELEAHYAQSHVTKRTYRCSKCPFTSTNRTSFQTHRNALHSSKTYDCELCNFSCKWASSLIRHKQTIHGNGKAHLCDICGMTFTQSSSVARHMKKVHK